MNATTTDAADWLTGRQLYKRTREIVEATKIFVARPDACVFQCMKDGKAKANQLIGYAIEYHHVVRAMRGLLAPRLYYDDLPTKALRAVGISREVRQPLPATLDLVTSLAAHAHEDPLSFKTLLFLFKARSASFNDAFVAACRRTDLPESFYKPMVAHANVNEVVALTMMTEVGAVTYEEALVVYDHAVNLVEPWIRQEREILSEYDYEGTIRSPLCA